MLFFINNAENRCDLFFVEYGNRKQIKWLKKYTTKKSILFAEFKLMFIMLHCCLYQYFEGMRWQRIRKIQIETEKVREK